MTVPSTPKGLAMLLVERDGISLDDAYEFVDELRQRVWDGEDPEELLEEELGLEPDYIFCLI